MPIINPTAQNAAVVAIVELIDIGSGVAVLELRTGNPPADITDPPTGTLLASENLPDPAFSSPSGGVVDYMDLPIAVTGLANGNIGHYRVTDQDGDTVIHSASVGVGIGELQVNKLDVTLSEDIEITAFSLAMPSGA